MAAEIKGDLEAGQIIQVMFNADLSNASTCILATSWIPQSDQHPGHVDNIIAGSSKIQQFKVPTDVIGLSILVVTQNEVEATGTLSVKNADEILDSEKIQCPSVWDYGVL